MSKLFIASMFLMSLGIKAEVQTTQLTLTDAGWQCSTISKASCDCVNQVIKDKARTVSQAELAKRATELTTLEKTLVSQCKVLPQTTLASVHF